MTPPHCQYFLLLIALQLFFQLTAASWASWHHSTNDFHPRTGRRMSYKNPRNAPSEYCPRDDILAQQQGRTCLRKCVSDEDCKSKRKKCLCDGTCGLSCIKPEKECGDVEGPLELGDVHVTGKVFGSKAIYSCPEGFRVIGLEERVCQADGTWSGTPPACKKNIYCTQPPVIDHARHNAPLEQTTFPQDTSLQYQCFPGYVTKGFARTQCFPYNGTSKWFGPDITCEPRSCGEATEILNGYRSGACHHFTCKVTYHCQPGFELLGKSAYSCLSDGTWSPVDLPSCVPVQCPIPENPKHGKAVYTSVSFNSYVNYECKYGYMLVGEGNRRCGVNKKWTEAEPLCKEINCGSPGLLHNGWLEGSRTTLHAVVLFHCLKGTTFEGADRSVCQSDGTWSHPLPKCYEINCGDPGFLSNGWVENMEKSWSLGVSLIFRCFDKMTLVGQTSSVCHVDGKWRYPLPKCLAPCTIPPVTFGNVTSRPEILSSANETANTIPIISQPGTMEQHGKVIGVQCEKKYDTTYNITPSICFNGTNESENTMSVILQPGTMVPHGKVIGVQCEKKYEPTYNITPSTCFNGTWTHAPKCQPARCKHLPKAPRNGMVIAPKTEHGMKARFTCRDGFNLIGHNVTECQYGDWIGESPFCNQTFCKYPGSIPDGKVLLVGNMGLYDYRNYVTKVANNRQITFDCNKGYVLSDGPLGKTCIHGEWSPKTDPPRCLPSQHPNFRWIRRKRRAIKPGSGNIVRNKPGGGGGSGTRRNTKRRKLPNGEEDYDLSPLECTDLSVDPYIAVKVIEHGEEANNSFSSGTVLNVSCTDGYGVNLPNATVKCVHGYWRPIPPQCDALPCKTPHIWHGSFFNASVPSKGLYFQESVKHTKKIEFRCSKGYTLKGPNRMSCWYGEWDLIEPPECIPATCVLPQVEYGNYIGGYRSGATITHNKEVDYMCGGDFRKIVPGPSRCHLGEWRPSKPHCFHSSVAFNYTDLEYDLPGFTGSDKKRKGVGGRDFVSKGVPGNNGKKSCGQPPKEKGAIGYVEGKPVDYDNDFNFPDEAVTLYKCANPKSKARNRWKATCEDGSWVGSGLPCEGDVPEGMVETLLKLVNGPCTFDKKEKHVVTFFNNQEILKEDVDFPFDTFLISRCYDIGKFELHGSWWRKCVSGQWLGVKPTCEGLSQFNDYALDRPPTILFRYVNGSIVQSNDGKLVIYPGTTVHMECIWMKKFGKPRWDHPKDVILSRNRTYQIGWTDEPGREPTLEFRLTIDNAQEIDNGFYTCLTPSKHSHRVEVVIKKVECPAHPEHHDLEYSTTNRELGTFVTFKCRSGNAVVGAAQIYCTAVGNWSAPYPRCENIECADISILPAMAPLAYTSVTKNGSLVRNETAPPKITIGGRNVGAKAHFTCPQGFVIHGVTEATCQSSGEWSSNIPLCKEMECDDPTPPENGHVSGSSPPYKAGDLVQFECDQGFTMESSQNMVACQDNGIWSRISGLKCVQACTYPGTIIGGTISQVRFYYKVHETVTFDCIEGYTLSGTQMLHCLKSGKWSTSIPNCIADKGGSRS